MRKQAPRANLARGALSIRKALKPQPINHFPLYVLIELCKSVCFFANTSFVVANEECEVEPKGIFDYCLDCFKFSFTEIMLVLQNKHGVGVFTIVVNEIKRDRRFAILVRLSVFVLLHYGCGEGLRRGNYLLAINISPLAEMVICVAIASRNVFIVRNCLYVRKCLGDRLLIYCAAIDLGAVGVNNVEPKAVIGINESLPKSRAISFAIFVWLWTKSLDMPSMNTPSI